MCNFSNDEDRFGYIVDTPEIRGLIDETQRLMREITDDAERVEALQPAFAKLLGADGWLPEQYGSPWKAAWAAALVNTRSTAPKTGHSASSRWSFRLGHRPPSTTIWRGA